MNLVVKVILHQFNVPKAQADEVLDVVSQVLVELAGDIKIEEEAMDDGNGEDDNRVEGWINPCDEMSQDELDELDLVVCPVQCVLVKVSSNSSQTLIGVLALTWNPAAKLAYVIKNSTSILLPHWVQLLEDLAKDANLSNANPLAVWMMPCD